MSFILGSMLSSGAGGLLDYDKEQRTNQAKVDLELELAKAKQEMADKARKAQATERTGLADTIAAKRGSSIDPAEEAYRNATPTDGGSPYLERPEVKQGLLAARKEATTPTGRDHLEADVQLGYASGEKLADYDQKADAYKQASADRLDGLLQRRDLEEEKLAETKRVHDLQYGDGGALRKDGSGATIKTGLAQSAEYRKSWAEVIKDTAIYKTNAMGEEVKDNVSTAAAHSLLRKAQSMELDPYQLQPIVASAIDKARQEAMARAGDDPKKLDAYMALVPRKAEMLVASQLGGGPVEHNGKIVGIAWTEEDAVRMHNGGDKADSEKAAAKKAQTKPGSLPRFDEPKKK